MEVVHTRQPQAQDRFPTFRIWGRLLWKEWREDWPILLIGVALPLLTLPMSKREGWGAFDISVLGLVAILVTLWAADRAQRAGLGRTDTRIYLPATMVTRWLFIYLVPMAVPALIGLSVGWMIAGWHPGRDSVLNVLAAGMLYILSAFLLSTTLTAIFTALPAIIAGVVWAFATFDIGLPAAQLPLFIGMIAICLVATVLWETVARKRNPLAGRIVLALLLLFVVFHPWELGPELGLEKSSYSGPHVPSSVIDRQRYLRVSVHNIDRKTTRVPAHLTYQEVELAVYLRKGEEQAQLVQTFPQIAEPLGFIDGTHVLVGHQPAGSPIVHLFNWDIRSNIVTETGRFTAVRDFLTRASGVCLTPDGRYLAVTVRNARQSNNLWIVDLPHGQVTMAMANVMMELNSLNECAWIDDRLYIGNYSRPNVIIDLQTMRGRIVTAADLRRTR